MRGAESQAGRWRPALQVGRAGFPDNTPQLSGWPCTRHVSGNLILRTTRVYHFGTETTSPGRLRIHTPVSMAGCRLPTHPFSSDQQEEGTQGHMSHNV